MLVHHRHDSETTFKWRFTGGSMMTRLKWYFDPPSPHKLRNNVVNVGPTLTKLSGFAHGTLSRTHYGSNNKQHGVKNRITALAWTEVVHVRIQRWGQGCRTPPPPLENYKKLGFLSNTGPDPLKITKLPSQHSMLGHHRLASETPFKWRLAGGPVMARL